jgi:hypothetical protein
MFRRIAAPSLRLLATRAVSTARLCVVRPDLATEWHEAKNGAAVDAVMTDAVAAAWWRCARCCAEWQASAAERTQHDTGCPSCDASGSGGVSEFVAAEDTLSHQFPLLSRRWDDLNGGVTADDVTPTSTQLVWWRGEGDQPAFQRRVCDFVSDPSARIATAAAHRRDAITWLDAALKNESQAKANTDGDTDATLPTEALLHRWNAASERDDWLRGASPHTQFVDTPATVSDGTLQQRDLWKLEQRWAAMGHPIVSRVDGTVQQRAKSNATPKKAVARQQKVSKLPSAERKSSKLPNKSPHSKVPVQTPRRVDAAARSKVYVDTPLAPGTAFVVKQRQVKAPASPAKVAASEDTVNDDAKRKRKVVRVGRARP